MSDTYDIVPQVESDDAKAYAVDLPLEDATEALEDANDRFAEYGISFGLVESTGERETTGWEKDGHRIPPWEEVEDG